jgi:hypothetical protein
MPRNKANSNDFVLLKHSEAAELQGLLTPVLPNIVFSDLPSTTIHDFHPMILFRVRQLAAITNPGVADAIGRGTTSHALPRKHRTEARSDGPSFIAHHALRHSNGR